MYQVVDQGVVYFTGTYRECEAIIPYLSEYPDTNYVILSVA